MKIEGANVPVELAKAIVFDLEERIKFGTNLLYLGDRRYLDSYNIKVEDPKYSEYKQFLFLAKQLINFYYKSQVNSLLPELPLKFGSVSEIRGRINEKKVAQEIIGRYPTEKKLLISKGRINHPLLMSASLIVKRNILNGRERELRFPSGIECL